MASDGKRLGIVGFGLYVPRLRLKRDAIFQANAWFAPGLRGLAKGERAMANWDEDAVTMAVEAARNCLGEGARNGIGTVAFASTTSPFADRQNAGIVKEALNLPDEVHTFDFAGGQRAGTSALVQALKAADSTQQTLVIGSEKHVSRPGSETEMTDGDAASAFLIGASDCPVATLIGTHHLSIDFVDHFRATGSEFDYGWEARWIRDEGHIKIVRRGLSEALKGFGLAGADVAHLVVPFGNKAVAEGVAKSAGIASEAIADTLASTVGNCGSAHPLLMLANVLGNAAPGQKIVLLGFGQGVDVLVLEAGPGLEQQKQKGLAALRRKAETNYMKYLAFAGHLQLDRGMRAELDNKQPMTALYRNRKAVFALVGGRCTKSGAVQFPRSEISVASNDATVGTQEDYPLADRVARIVSFTADSLAYTLSPPNCYGMVEFEGGGRMVCEFTDVEPDMLAVGTPMRMMFRIKAVDERRAFTKYFWKAVAGGK